MYAIGLLWLFKETRVVFGGPVRYVYRVVVSLVTLVDLVRNCLIYRGNVVGSGRDGGFSAN